MRATRNRPWRAGLWALQVDRPQHIRLVEAPQPAPREGEALVRLRRLSICGSDMRYYRRALPEERYPLPPGVPCHECAGEVVESRIPGLAPGTRAIVLPEMPNLDGGTEFMAVTPSRLIPLPPEGDLSGWVVCQPFGTVLYALKRLGNPLGLRVAVLGQGAIGLLFTLMLHRLGASTIFTVEPVPYRRRLSRRLGADRALDPGSDDVVGEVMEATGGRGVDLAVEAAGEEEALNTALALVRHGGTVACFGFPEVETVRLNYDEFMRREVLLLPSVSNSSQDPSAPIREAVRMVAEGRVDLSWMVTHRLPLREVDRAYQLYSRRAEGVVKVVVEA